MRELQPWHENLGKRQVKAPKIYVRDTSLLHALLDIRTGRQLEMHSKVGASWEGFVIDQVIQALDAARTSAFSGASMPVRSWTCWWYVARGGLASK